jgi:hypothetical protein
MSAERLLGFRYFAEDIKVRACEACDLLLSESRRADAPNTPARKPVKLVLLLARTVQHFFKLLLSTCDGHQWRQHQLAVGVLQCLYETAAFAFMWEWRAGLIVLCMSVPSLSESVKEITHSSSSSSSSSSSIGTQSSVKQTLDM